MPEGVTLIEVSREDRTRASEADIASATRQEAGRFYMAAEEGATAWVQVTGNFMPVHQEIVLEPGVSRVVIPTRSRAANMVRVRESQRTNANMPLSDCRQRGPCSS